MQYIPCYLLRFKNKIMSTISKSIILDELLENSHVEQVEDVIFWALEHYCKDKNTNGSLVAYAIKERIKDAERENDLDLLNPKKVNAFLKE